MELSYLYWDRMLANRAAAAQRRQRRRSPGPLMATYYASESYVLSFSEAMWEEARDTAFTELVLPGPHRVEIPRTRRHRQYAARSARGTAIRRPCARALRRVETSHASSHRRTNAFQAGL